MVPKAPLSGSFLRALTALYLLTACPFSGAAEVAENRPPEKADDGGVEVYRQVESPRGRRPNKIFLDASDIDSIDTASGNVTVRVPLGQSYQVGPLISYQLQAVHNSNAWDSVTIRCYQPDAPWICDDYPPADFAVPNVSSNAGLGWEVHFGRLFAPQPGDGTMDEFQRQRWPNADGDANQQDDDFTRWLYVAPDGARHELFDLADRERTYAGRPVRYSKDSSFLRLKFPKPGIAHLEHPNGVISIFNNTAEAAGTLFCDDGPAYCWRFDSQVDPYGNSVKVKYARNWGTETETWTISDSTGRVHRLNFSFANADTHGGDGTGPFSTDQGDEWGDLRTVLKSVDLAAFGGQRAIQQFQRTNRTVTRGCPHDANDIAAHTSNNSGYETLTIPILDRITVPDSQPWEFTTSTSPQAGSCDSVAGTLSRVKAPAQGAIGFSYGWWRFPTKCIYTYVPAGLDLEYSKRGVSHRRTYRVDGSLESTTAYTNELFPPQSDLTSSGANCSRANYRRTVVWGQAVDGKYKRQLLFHSVTQGPKTPTSGTPISQWQVTDNGMPYSKASKIGTSNANYRFLSRVIEECTTGGGCVAKRKIYQRYMSQFRNTCWLIDTTPGCFAIDPMPIRTTEVFHDDGGKSIDVINYGSNGAGKFRTTDTVDNFAGTSQLNRVSTAYTATGTATILAPNQTTGYLQPPNPIGYLPSPAASWILHPFNWRRHTSPGGLEYFVDYRFNTKGFMTCLRRRANPAARGPQDVVVSLTYGTTPGQNKGLPITEVFAGGTPGNLSSSICDTSGSTTDGSLYTIDHTYQKFTLASSKFRGDSAYAYRAAIDANTGLESATYDVADQRTRYTYDLLGRLESELPDPSLQAAATYFTYDNPAGDGPSMITERKDGSTVLEFRRTFYDGFVRPVKEIARRPISTSTNEVANSRKGYSYDRLGRLLTETTWQDSSTFSWSKATVFGNYDIFGRARRITRPDDQVETRTFQGERLSTSQVAVRTSLAGNTPVTTTSEKNAQGRLIRVTQPLYETTNTYDPYGQRLTTKRAGGGTSQTRSYGYDARGLLLWESLPELGSTTSNGTRNYNPDAMGNIRRAWGSGVDLKYGYDSGGRLTRVSETNGGKLWEEFAYGANNSGSNYQKGRLRRAVRHNYPKAQSTTSHWTITEEYEYRGTLGQMTKKRVLAEDVQAGFTDAVFDTGFGYDRLGNRNWLSHPTCITTPGTTERNCSDGPNDLLAPTRVTTTTMVENRPTVVQSKFNGTVDMWAKYSYHPNFQVSRVGYLNGDHMALTQGTDGMARPAQIQVKRNASVYWDSGAYSYDGAGNIWAIGADRYYFDKASRLLYGTADFANSGRKEEYTYDAFDNIRSLRRDGGTVIGHVVDERSNRLLRDSNNSNLMSNLGYDAAGNLVQAGRRSDNAPLFEMEYDALNMQTRFQLDADGGSSPDLWYTYVYGPGNYRLIQVDLSSNYRTYKFRDTDGTILREYEVRGFGKYFNSVNSGAQWLFEEDLIEGATGTFARRTASNGIYYLHPDHLGTPRLITDAAGSVRSRHHYYPYGRYIQQGPQIMVPNVEFTGHEGDPHGFSDYMLGRTYLEAYLRFATVDPARDGWNLYGYVGGNPINRNDPTGLADEEGEINICLTCNVDLIATGLGSTIGIVTNVVGGAKSRRGASLLVNAAANRAGAQATFRIGAGIADDIILDTAIQAWEVSGPRAEEGARLVANGARLTALGTIAAASTIGAEVANLALEHVVLPEMDRTTTLLAQPTYGSKPSGVSAWQGSPQYILEQQYAGTTSTADPCPSCHE